jgi:hypothetical protein
VICVCVYSYTIYMFAENYWICQYSCFAWHFKCVRSFVCSFVRSFFFLSIFFLFCVCGRCIYVLHSNILLYGRLVRSFVYVCVCVFTYCILYLIWFILFPCDIYLCILDMVPVPHHMTYLELRPEPNSVISVLIVQKVSCGLDLYSRPISLSWVVPFHLHRARIYWHVCKDKHMSR